MTRINADEITAAQLEALRSEAVAHGDSVMVNIVDDALESDCELRQADALDECARVIQAAIDANDEASP